MPLPQQSRLKLPLRNNLNNLVSSIFHTFFHAVHPWDLGSFIFPARVPEAASPYQGSLSHIKGNGTHQRGAEGLQSHYPWG